MFIMVEGYSMIIHHHAWYHKHCDDLNASNCWLYTAPLDHDCVYNYILKGNDAHIHVL